METDIVPAMWNLSLIHILLEADSEEDVRIKADENSGVAWFTPEEALQKSTEPWFVERIYGKLIEKVKRI